MSELEKILIDYKDFIKDFKPIRKARETQLGEVMLMKNSKDNRNVWVKEQVLQSEQHLDEVLKALEYVLPLNRCRSFLEFIGFSIKKLLNTDLYHIYMIYESCEQSLEKELSFLQKSEACLEEEEMWNLIESLANAVNTLDALDFVYGDLRPANVLFDKNKSVKLLYTHYNKSSYERLIEEGLSTVSK
jgi:serine/threonine protein kinase